MKKPVSRRKVRLLFGVMYYRIKRYLQWLQKNRKFAKQRFDALMEYEFACHSTPLIRSLKNVDMYMQHNKITNLKLAVKKINSVVIYPGEYFSYWKLIGKPTKAKGYLPAMILHSGKVKAGIGGGLCQLSNLIYWMTLHTPLTVIERHRHSYDVFPDSGRTQPFGSGATCFYNYIDLVIRNDTAQPFQLFVYVTETHLEGCWKSNMENLCRYEVYEHSHRFEKEFWGGYTRHNILRRKITRLDTNEVTDEFVTENHAVMMYDPLIEDKREKKIEFVEKSSS